MKKLLIIIMFLLFILPAQATVMCDDVDLAITYLNIYINNPIPKHRDLLNKTVLDIRKSYCNKEILYHFDKVLSYSLKLTIRGASEKELKKNNDLSYFHYLELLKLCPLQYPYCRGRQNKV